MTERRKRFLFFTTLVSTSVSHPILIFAYLLARREGERAQRWTWEFFHRNKLTERPEKRSGWLFLNVSLWKLDAPRKKRIRLLAGEKGQKAQGQV